LPPLAREVHLVEVVDNARTSPLATSCRGAQKLPYL
jgi:hypothetical protein